MVPLITLRHGRLAGTAERATLGLDYHRSPHVRSGQVVWADYDKQLKGR